MVKEHSSAARVIEDQYAQERKSIEGELDARRKIIAERLKTIKAGDTDSLEAEAEQLQSKRARLVQDEKRAIQERRDEKKSDRFDRPFFG